LGDLIVAHPGVLLGIGAVLLPILIHLLLRPRPRRMRFPALALLHAAFASGTRANRVRNVLLMAVRAALLALAALLLAGPTCTRPEAAFVGTEPLACAIVLDDSASMTYRLDAEATILSLARREALALTQEAPSWPAGSGVNVYSAGDGTSTEPRFGDAANAAESLCALAAVAPHARPLGAALLAAGAGLREAGQPQRRLVVFTDGAAHAWQDVTPATLAGIDHLSVRVVVPDATRRSNLAIRGDDVPRRTQPAAAPLALTVTLAAEGVDGQCRLSIEESGQSLARLGPVTVPADGDAAVPVELPPRPAGPHTFTLRLDPPDRLDFDQQRWLAVQTGPPPIVWLVAANDAGEPEPITPLLFENLLAPAALPRAQQLVSLRKLVAESVPDVHGGDRSPALIIVVSGANASPAAANTLLDHAERGATLLLVPGDDADECTWPELERLLTPATVEVEDLPSLTALQWMSPPDAIPAELEELTRCAVRRRVRLDALADEAEVLARYADGVPAIVQRRHGAGRLLLLTTSPAPAWSDLGIRAAGLLTWLHELVDEATGPPTAVATFTLGQQTRQPLGGLPPGGLVQVVREAATEAAPVWVRLKEGVPETPWPTDRAGAYAVSAAGQSGPSARYVVNWPPEESQLAPISSAELRRRLGLEDVVLETAAERHATPATTLSDRLLPGGDLRPLLGAALLAVFAAEMVLSARRAGRSSRTTA
jgi:hypothetical protein